MPDPSPRLDQLELLKHADVLSRDFPPEERADILVDLAAAAVPIERSQAKAWANQLFHISLELPYGQFRASVQKSALCVIARVDADRAAFLWRLQNAPETWTQGKIVAEDFRSEGTRVLFPALWEAKQEKSVRTIQGIANWLGQTGQYPYAAVAEIMQKLPATDGRSLQAFYTAGISYLPNGKLFETTNRQFVEFILKTRNLVNPDSLVKALHTAVQWIETDANIHRFFAAHAPLSTRGISISRTSEAERLLAELLPTIRDVDPDLALRLTKRYSSLRNPKDSAATGHSGIPSVEDKQTATTEDATEEILLGRVQALAPNDRKLATQIAGTIRDRDMQSIALANLSSSYIEADEEEFTSWTNSANCCLDNMRPEIPKLSLMVALCSAYIRRSRFPEAMVTINEAFALGELLFHHYVLTNSGALAHSAPSFVLLCELVETAARSLPSPSLVTNAVETLDQTLRARMLVVTVAALSKQHD